MALRTQRLSDDSAQLTEEDWKLRLRGLQRACGAALASSDIAAWQQQLDSLAEWDEINRSLQADLMVFEMMAESRGRPEIWSQQYLAFAEHLIKQLAANPLEPERWNMLGVSLYELGENKSAERCFKALSRLYPEHASLVHNQKAVRRRRRAGVPKRPFRPDVIQACLKAAKHADKVALQAHLPAAEEQTISLVMIVKDEAEMLEECLQSAAGLVDEIIVVDTGSSDRTVEIAESFEARVFSFPWTGSFAEARNESLRHASGQWVLHLDADERLIEDDVKQMRSLLNRVYCEGFTLVETNYTGEEGSGAAVVHAPLRVWRNRPQYQFEGAIHEQKTRFMPHYLPARFQASGVRILHYGYLKEMIQGRDKSQRNLKLLTEEARQNPNPFNSFNLGNEYALLDDNNSAAVAYENSWADLQASDKFRVVGYSGMLAKGLVRQLRMAGQYEKSQQYCDQALKLLPQHTDLVLEKAYLALQEGQLEQAEACALQAIEMGEAPPDMCGVVGSGSFLPRALLGEIAERQGDLAAAVSTYRYSLQHDPQYLGVVGPLGRVLLRSGSSGAEVLQELDEVASTRLGTAGLMLGHSLYEQKAITEARSLYERILSSEPGNPIARLGLVECLLTEGELKQAIALTQPLTGSDAASAALLRSRLFCQLTLNQTMAAQQSISSATELGMEADQQQAFSAWADLQSGLSPDSLSAEVGLELLALLPAALQLKEVDAAEALIVLTSMSNLPAGQKNQLSAEAFLHCGYLDSAAEAWLSSIDQLGPDAESLFGLAQIALAQGRVDEARALSQDVLSLDQQHASAKLLLENTSAVRQ
jgi:tetratricopeptide (TPR) repeat protein